MADEEGAPQQYAGEDEDGEDRNRGVPKAAAESVGGVAVPTDLRPGEENYVQDAEKARSMTTAEDNNRTEAAKSRTAKRILEDFPDEHATRQEAIRAAMPFPEVTSHRPKKKREQEAAREEAQRQYHSTNQAIWEHEQAARGALLDADFGFAETESALIDAARAKSDYEGYGGHRDSHRGHIERLKERAEAQDRQADRMGEWAGLLHDNPPSEAFKASNSRLYRYESPHELIAMEDHLIAYRERYAEEARQRVEKLEQNPPEDLEHAQRVIGDVADNYSIDSKPEDPADDGAPETYAAESRDIAKSLLEQIRSAYDDDMTVAQIKQRAIDVTRLGAELEASEARAMARALEDIRTGKAADPNYSVEGESDDGDEPSATQPHPWRQTDRGIDLAGIGEKLGFEEPKEGESPTES